MLSKLRKTKLEKNLWKYYLYRVFSALSFISPIYVLFLLDNGLSMTQVMIVEAVYTATIMLAVVPSGIAADYFGRKKVLITNGILFTLSWVLYAISYSFAGFMIASFIIALSSAMWQASGTAFFYDTLRELKREKSFKRLYGNVIGINYTMWGLSSLAGAYMATYSFRLPFWGCAVTSFLALIMLFTITETKKYKHGDKHYITHLKDASKFAATHPKVRLIMIYAAITCPIWFAGYMLYQPYLQSINVSIVHIGWVYAAIFLFGAVGSKLAHRIEKFLGEKKILIYILLVMIASYLLMSKQLILIGAAFPIILTTMLGIIEPTVQDYINKHTESHHRATVLSLGTLLTNGFSSLIIPFFGWVVDFWSLSAAFLIAAGILVINLVVLAVSFVYVKNHSAKL